MPLQDLSLQDLYLCSYYKKANQLWSKKYPSAALSETESWHVHDNVAELTLWVSVTVSGVVVIQKSTKKPNKL